MQATGRFLRLAALASFCLAMPNSRAAQPAPPIPIPPGEVHSKPFLDPQWAGSADPCMVWNAEAGEYFVYYTARRANLKEGKGVEWMHGSAVGIASTRDGAGWTYRGTCKGDDNLDSPLKAPCSWWAPHVLRHDGVYHMYVTWVDGIYPTWNLGKKAIKHFTSPDGITWKFQSRLTLTSDRCIDPAVYRVGDKWWMWFKDAGTIKTAVSDDLDKWTSGGKAFEQPCQYEAPFVSAWNGVYYLLVDTMKTGLHVYRSDNGAGGWTYLNRLPFTASHGGICEVGDRRLLVCHCRASGTGTDPENKRQTQILIAELTVNADGKLVVKK